VLEIIDDKVVPSLHDGESLLEIARQEPDRCRVIDGTPSAEAVGRAVWAAVEQRLLAGAR